MFVASSRVRTFDPIIAVTTLALVFATGPAAGVHAAPARAAAPTACEAEPTLDEARLMTGRDLWSQAKERYEAKDYVAAVTAWEQVLLLMPAKAAELRVPLAHAHLAAYETENDAEHLREARRLLETQLASLGPDSAERSEITAELADTEAKLEELARAERQAQERRDEQIRREAQAKLEAQRQAEVARNRATIRKIYNGVGGSLVGLGAGSLAAMSAFLVNGERLDQAGQTMATMAGVDDGAYQALLVRGEIQNKAAVATGVVGGLLTTLGVTLLAVAAARYKPERPRRVALRPAPGGVQVRF